MTNWGINKDNLLYYKGWFQNTVPAQADIIESICFLRLDGDLYESTKVCLEYLYPKISKGGYIVIDDYQSLTGCKKAVDEYLAEHTIKPDMKQVNGLVSPYTFANPVYWQIQ